ncbi:MAG: transposase [Planctomycetota bacterium]
MVCLVLKTFFNTDYRGIVQILDDCSTICQVFELKSTPHFTTLQKASKRLLKSAWAQKFIENTAKLVMGKRKTVKLTALDSTGLQSGHISPYFLKRRSNGQKPKRNTQATRWPKVAAVVDVTTHLILAVHPCRGPGRDITHFKGILKTLPNSLTIQQLLADAGYDSEQAHRYARETLNIKTTIPPLIGRRARGLPKTYYRRQMKTDFDTENYRQRWQAETVFSMLKRNLGYTVFGHQYWSQCRDIMLMVLTHNFMIVLLVKELFYRAGIS